MAAAHRVCEDVVTVKAFRSPSPRPTSTSWPKSLEVGRNSSNYLQFLFWPLFFIFYFYNTLLMLSEFRTLKNKFNA